MRAQPARARLRQGDRQLPGIVHMGRTAIHRLHRGGRRRQMDMMIVQPGQKGTAIGFQNGFIRLPLQFSDRCDPVPDGPHVLCGTAPDFGAADQHDGAI